MSLQRFFFYSIVVHIFIIVAIILSIPVVKENKKGREFFTQLVSPKEFLSQKPVPLPAPKIRSLPHVPQTVPRVNVPSQGKKNTKRMQSEKQVFREEPRNSSGDLKEPISNMPLIPSGNSGQSEFSGEMKTDHGNKEPTSKPDKATPSLREKLFDKSIIGDLAKRDFEKGEKERKDKAFTFDVKEYKFLIYNQRLKERIENIWIYPPDAAAKGIYGDLIIRFTIKKNGKLGAVELVRTSGHKNLDDAAIRALQDAAPFWPLPEEWGMEGYTIEGHFVYSMYGYYVM